MDIREKPISNLTSDRTWKDMTVEACLCGNTTFYIVAKFRDGELAGYFTEAMCFSCNAWYKIPAESDKSDDYVGV